MHRARTQSHLALLKVGPRRLGAVLGLACALLAAAGASRALAEPIDLPGWRGPERFDVAAPDAPSSAASRVLPVRAPARAAVATGYTALARLVFKAESVDAVRAALHAADPASGGKLVRLVRAVGPDDAPLKGYWQVDVPTVREAARLGALLVKQPGVQAVAMDMVRPRAARALPTDPLFGLQWHLYNSEGSFGTINVAPAWDAGYTGTGVTVGILETSFNTTHPDLSANFNAQASQTSASFDPHPTACAGLVAAVANNARGGAGVAYGAKISTQTYGSDTQTATAMLFRNDLNAIKSNSWGPPDTGTIWDITPVELDALQQSVTTGRGGLGTMFFWAAGNGALGPTGVPDRSDYDQYASSRFVINVGAIGPSETRANYSEKGSSLLVVAPSSADFAGSGNSGIVTTWGATTSNTSADYTSSFGGTSAAAPIAAGVGALILQARPTLTWRDVMHVLVRSARRCDPGNPSWTINGGGRFVSEDYGFGVIDAAGAVSTALTFVSRGPERSFQGPLVPVNQPIPDNAPGGVASSVIVPSNLLVEKVQVTLNAPHPSLGDLRIVLTSPAGTQSVLATTRSDTTSGYSAFVFTSARHWDERAQGAWQLRVSDGAPANVGTFASWKLSVFGAPPPCACKWIPGAGSPQVADIFAFLSDWFAGLGDFNNDGIVGVPDVFAFLSCWFAGC